MNQDSLHSIVQEAEKNLTTGTVKLGEYVEWSLHDTVETIFAYLNSKHISGSKDALGRDKPFFNIVTAAVNIWYRATDLDRKDIVVMPNSQSTVVPAFLATIYLQEWMKKARFSVFLNTWGRTLAAYGSAVVKFVERNGELYASVVPWNRLIVDPIDFNALPHIEKFYKTPAQLKNMATPGHPDYAGYNMDAVKSLLDSQQTRETLRGEKKDNMSDFIELYEVHGNLSQYVYFDSQGKKTEEGDEDIFFQQMHVISWVGEVGKDNKNFTLYSGKEKRDPYMITHLIEEDGRTLSIGAVEYLFDAQWMQNHTMKAWKDQMDLASRLVFQTADPNFVGKNVISNIEVGDILTHIDQKPIEPFPNTGHDITNLLSFSQQWRALGQELTSTPEAARGITPPSGTALGTVQIVTGQGLSLFEIMVENKANALDEMMREFVLPYIKKKMNNTDELMAILEERDIRKIDAMYVPREAVRRFNNRVIEEVLAGKTPQPFNKSIEEASVMSSLSEMGNQRALSPGDITWSEVTKDLEWKLDIAIANEQYDKQVILQTLSSVLQTLATNPLVLQDPNMKLLFNKILSFTNIVSPVELSVATAPQMISQPQEMQKVAPLPEVK